MSMSAKDLANAIRTDFAESSGNTVKNVGSTNGTQGVAPFFVVDGKDGERFVVTVIAGRVDTPAEN